MQTLLLRIQLGIGAGAALSLAGTGCSTPLIVNNAPPDANTDAQTVADAGRDAMVVVDAAVDAGPELQPYPLSALGCGLVDAGFSAYCCRYATCFTPDSGPSCPTLAAAEVRNGYPFGQTDCEAEGPFAPNPNDPNQPAGNCCYIAGSVAVEGRPLFVDHAALVAPIVTRADWLVG